MCIPRAPVGGRIARAIADMIEYGVSP